MTKNIDEYYMDEALKEAQRAFNEREVPIGAVVVNNNKIIGRAHNQVETLKDATAHAEMIAITQAANTIGDWRLDNAVLYVTKEPCVMCAGAIINSRIKKLVFGVNDPQVGAAGGLLNLVKDSRLRHPAIVVQGVREEECRNFLQEFFIKLRNKTKELN